MYLIFFKMVSCWYQQNYRSHN